MNGPATSGIQNSPLGTDALPTRAYPLGAQVTDQGVTFRCWAPKPRLVEVIFEPQGTVFALTRASDG
ncbi:MAG TPA: hypothetical protein VM842_03390 [Nitrospira sp.]|nr:hypothetical protein [Nitrospira sp.]